MYHVATRAINGNKIHVFREQRNTDKLRIARFIEEQHCNRDLCIRSGSKKSIFSERKKSKIA